MPTTGTVPAVSIAGLRDGKKLGTIATPRAMKGTDHAILVQKAVAPVPAGPARVALKVVVVQRVIVPNIIVPRKAACRAEAAARVGHAADTKCTAVAQITAAPAWLTIPGATVVAKVARHIRFTATESPATFPAGTIALALAARVGTLPHVDISAATTVAVQAVHSPITAQAAVPGLAKRTMDMHDKLHPPIATGTGLRVGMAEPIVAPPTAPTTIARKTVAVHAANTVHAVKTVRVASMGHVPRVAGRTHRRTPIGKTTIAKTAAEFRAGMVASS